MRIYAKEKTLIIRLGFWMMLVFPSLISKAQTVVWAMQPKGYDTIEPIGKNLFKVTNNNKIGLINADGTVVVEPVCDNLIGYYENKALLVRNDEGKGERIIGCLTGNGEFYKFSKKFYTLTGQKFYSEGLISVSNEKGKKGYVDEAGNNEFCFDKNYTNIKPFSGGYAVVRYSKSNGLLIDSEGNETKFHFPGGVGASIKRISSVYEGILYVQDDENETYSCDMNADAGKLFKTEKPVDMKSLDYLSRLSSKSGKTKDTPYETKRYFGTKGLNPNKSNGLTGYNKGNTQILPCQLQSASSFVDGYAVVEHNGEKGILKYVEGSSFDVMSPSEAIEFSPEKNVKCSFSLTVPPVWKGKIAVMLKKTDGQQVSLSNTEDNYEFEIKPSSDQETYALTITGESLKLFETQLTYKFKEIINPINIGSNSKPKPKPNPLDEPCKVCKKKKRDCPYRGKHYNVKK